MIGDRGRLNLIWAWVRLNLAAFLRRTNLGPACNARTRHAIIRLALLLALAPAIPAGAAEDPTSLSWSNLSDQQQEILAPLRADWNQLPDYQRRRLLGAVERYPTLAPDQQQRFSARLLKWSRLSLEQRNVARDLYRKIQELSPAQRSAIVQRWKAAEASQSSGPH